MNSVELSYLTASPNEISIEIPTRNSSADSGQNAPEKQLAT